LDLFNHRPPCKNTTVNRPPSCQRPAYAFIKPDAALFGSKFKFAKHGKCGAELSETLPELAKVVDDIAIINSMNTIAFNHAPGQIS